MANEEQEHLNMLEDLQSSNLSSQSSFEDETIQTLESNDDLQINDLSNEPSPEESLEPQPHEAPLKDLDENKTQEDQSYKDELNNLQKKKPKWIKILLIVIGVLVVIMIAIVGLYFGGIFNDQEANTTKKQEHNKTKKTDTNVSAKPKYQFHIDDIKVERVNKKLALLNKYELDPNDRNISKIDDANTTIYDRDTVYLSSLEEKLKEQNNTLSDKNSSIVTPKQATNNQPATQTTTKQDNIKPTKDGTQPQKPAPKETKPTKEQNIKHTQKVTHPEQQATNAPQPQKKTPQENKKATPAKAKANYIQVVTLKYQLYKTFLDKVKVVDARISVCKDDLNRTQVFIGPFSDTKKRQEVMKQINTSGVVNDAFGVEFTQDEYNKRCNF